MSQCALCPFPFHSPLAVATVRHCLHPLQQNQSTRLSVAQSLSLSLSLSSCRLSVAALKSASGTSRSCCRDSPSSRPRPSSPLWTAPCRVLRLPPLHLSQPLAEPSAIRARCSCHNYNGKCSRLMTTTTVAVAAQWDKCRAEQNDFSRCIIRYFVSR